MGSGVGIPIRVGVGVGIGVGALTGGETIRVGATRGHGHVYGDIGS